jgi:hypothetical protein
VAAYGTNIIVPAVRGGIPVLPTFRLCSDAVWNMRAKGDVNRDPSLHAEEIPMRKAVTALAAAASIAAATIGASSTAEARWGGWWGPAIIGGFAAGAIVGSAYARPYPYGYYGYYAPAPVYYDYYMPAPAYYGYYGPRPYGGCWRYRYRYRYRVC